MQRTRVTVLIVLFVLALGGAGLFYAFKTGLIKPSADIAGSEQQISVTDAPSIQQGTFDGVEYSADGYLQLKAAQ